jgi:hypothetical protein
LLLLFAAFFIVEFAYPRFPSMDSEISSKAAGLHLSQGGAFAAPELEGFLHVDPPIERIYFVYPPLYTWLFGQWLHLTGFGWAACVTRGGNRMRESCSPGRRGRSKVWIGDEATMVRPAIGVGTGRRLPQPSRLDGSQRHDAVWQSA